jgi:hypothetical protein
MHFRTRNHKFPIKTGRWSQSFVPHVERKCRLCTINTLGDEYHYLLECPFFSNKRSKYIPGKFSNRPNMIKFKELLTASRGATLEKLGYFVKHIIEHFRRNNP